MKRRWPVLTTVVAAMYYIVSHYDIRGLDGLRIEPRATSTAQNIPGLGGSGLNWPGNLPGGPLLPSVTNAPGGAAPFGGNPWSQPLGSNVSGLPSVLPPTSAISPQQSGYATTLPSTAIPSTSLPGTSLPGTSLPSTSPLATPITLPGVPGAIASRLPSAVGAIVGNQDWNQLLTVGEKLGMLERAREPVSSPSVATGSAAGYPVNSVNVTVPQPNAPSQTITIASFNLNGWSGAGAQNPAATEVIVRMLRQFDVVALQDVRSRRDDVLPEFITQLNSTGRKYDFMIGPRVGRKASEQFAFVFDTERIETDRFQLYTVDDPEDLMACEPLVGWFRARQVDAREAFTFSLVNLRIDADNSSAELETLPSLVQAIAADGRGEDDIILLGDFSAAAPQSAFFSSNICRVVIDGIATTTRGTALLDNFCLPPVSTTEFTGRAGAVDFLRQYNLSLEQALSVSEHLPIWAEFSIIEGGRPGQVAGNAHLERRFQSGVN